MVKKYKSSQLNENQCHCIPSGTYGVSRTASVSLCRPAARRFLVMEKDMLLYYHIYPTLDNELYLCLVT